MCGIVGFVGNEENKGERIKKMTDRMIHRGPDQEGYYIDEMIALGHRRLSIIDLENGTQPMLNKDKNIVVTFNGEIYNYRELKKELELQGHEFTTNCDTEVLLHGYEQWGKELPKRLRGMFAFAVWDKISKTLFLARDHFGIKPLYYYQNEDTFMFASEIKAFLEHPKFKKELNKELIGPYLSFSFTPTAGTFFKGVYSLEAGTSLIFQKNQKKLQPYFELEFKEKIADKQTMVEEIRTIMKNSVQHHMVSDVEVGAFLSSGIDSSYLVSLAKTYKTYTVGYQNPKYSEIPYAQNLTAKLAISNTSKQISKQEYLRKLPEVLYYMDEPCSDASAVSLYFLSKLASEDVKVVISGEGADEFFCGYHTYQDEINFQWYNKIPFAIRRLFAGICEKFPEGRGRNFIVRRGKKLEEEYVGVNKIFSRKERKKVLSFKDTIKNKTITKPLLDEYKTKDNLIKMQAFDIKNWLIKDILLKVDKMTMANSLEARTPFVDKEVFEIASSIPQAYKVSKENTKIALREAAKKDIPNDSYKKKKLGFPVPLREWMRGEDVYNEIRKTISQEFVKEFFNPKYVLRLLEEHKNGKKDNYKKVWAIYSFIKWYEVFFRTK